MTESALEKARRELESSIAVRLGRKSCGMSIQKAIARLEAAARLAGRIEQVEKQIEWCAPGKTIRRSLVIAWRDRLRKEAGKEGE